MIPWSLTDSYQKSINIKQYSSLAGISAPQNGLLRQL
jgi:hypothetical protein